jgi:hypothetical protein
MSNIQRSRKKHHMLVVSLFTAACWGLNFSAGLQLLLVPTKELPRVDDSAEQIDIGYIQ